MDDHSPFPATTAVIGGGRYRIRSTLGRGGSATVYLADDLVLSRKVAVKMLRTDLADDASLSASFLAEARAAATLNDPHVVAVYDAGGGTEGEAPWLVLEYVDGSTLEALLPGEDTGAKQVDPLPVSQAVAITDQILQALESAHRQGIVHRDISPANVMITARGVVKVMDFGVAAAIDPQQDPVDDRRYQVRGTAHYIAPEYAAGRDVDARADLYATTCILFALLTGRPPFVDGSPEQIAAAHVRQEAPDPLGLRPQIPWELGRFIRRGLAKQPGGRFSDASEMRRLLGEAVGTAPVLAPRPGQHTASAQTTRSLPVLAGTSALPTVTGDRVPPRPVPMRPPRSLTPTTVVPAQRAAPASPVDNSRWGRAIALILVMLVAGATLPLWRMSAAPGVPETARPTYAAPTTRSVRIVPDVAGLTVEEATATLARAGLTVQSITTASSTSLPSGQVLSTAPAIGERSDGTVVLTVSTGPEMTVIPLVLGLSLTEARAHLANAGLQLADISRVDSPQGAETVLAVSPKQGSSTMRGARVGLTVASGAHAVPQLVGLPLEQARIMAQQSGFGLDVRSQDESSQPPGLVLHSQVTAGTSLRVGSTLAVTVSVQPAPSPTPHQDTTGNSPTVPPSTTATPAAPSTTAAKP